jgi:hypothetical protein
MVASLEADLAGPILSSPELLAGMIFAGGGARFAAARAIYRFGCFFTGATDTRGGRFRLPFAGSPQTGRQFGGKSHL